jgi:hypothetical protein
MTNMMPQSVNNNFSGTWRASKTTAANLWSTLNEVYHLRQLRQRRHVIRTDGYATTIAGGNHFCPAQPLKVVVVPPEVDVGCKLTTATRIAINTPTRSPATTWVYRTTGCH